MAIVQRGKGKVVLAEAGQIGRDLDLGLCRPC